MPDKKLKTAAAKTSRPVKIVSEKSVSKKTAKNTLRMDVYDIKGKVTASIDLPKEIFNITSNDALVSQAVRVYMANKRRGTASTKTRGEVQGSTRKIYRQKGTGRARHGGIRAPIFVHGGIVFGPKPRDYSLKLSKKMSRLALFTALSDKFREGQLKIVDGIEKIKPKTKEAEAVFVNVGLGKQSRKALLVTPVALKANLENVYRGIRNLSGVEMLEARMLNAYDILKNREIVFMKDSVNVVSKTFLKKN